MAVCRPQVNVGLSPAGGFVDSISRIVHVLFVSSCGVETKLEWQSRRSNRRLTPLETAVDEAIDVCDGDMRAALRAALIYNGFLERKLDMMRGMVSSGYSRGKISPARKASEKVDDWR
jgi:hypothetical protein